MERIEAIEFATKVMGIELVKAKKMATAQLIKKIETWKTEHPVIEEAVKKTEEIKTKAKVVKGQFIVGWKEGEHIRALKYCSIKRHGATCQTIIDSIATPEKMARVHVYKKESTAQKQIKIMQCIDPVKYAGLQIIVR